MPSQIASLIFSSEFYLEGGCWSQKRLTAFWSNSFSLLAFSHFRVWGFFFVVARVLRFSKGIGSGLLAASPRGLKLNAQRASQPASQLKEGQKDRVVFALSAIIGGIVAYQFPQKRTLLSMRGISVISHNTIIII